jgi:hypothetical protein
MSRGRNERTPAQLAVLTQAREKAKIVIAERAKLNAQMKKEEAVSEDTPPEPLSEEAPSQPVPPKEDSDSESEPRLTRREVGEMIQRSSPKYHYINGMYIKIK